MIGDGDEKSYSYPVSLRCSCHPCVALWCFSRTSPTTFSPPPVIAVALRDYSFDQSVMLLSRIGAMSGRVKMSKFLLTVCAFGLLLSPAFAEEKSPEQQRGESNQIGLQKMNWTRVVASGINQRIGFFYAVNPDCSASGDIYPYYQTTRTRQVFPTSKEKISATDAISTRFVASNLITSQPRNTSAAIHSNYSFSFLEDLPRRFILT